MSNPISNGVQGHLTLALTMKSPADGEALRANLPSVVPAFSKAADAVGALHYYRLIALDHKNFLFIAEYDGELEAILRAMATKFGPIFDGILGHVDAPPRMPVADNPDSFVEWAVENQISPFTVYEAYPGVSVRDIRSRADAAGIALDDSGVQQRPLLVIMPLKSRLAMAAVRMAFSVLQRYLAKGGSRLAPCISPTSYRSRTINLASLPSMTETSKRYTQDFARSSGRPSTCYSNSPSIRRPRLLPRMPWHSASGWRRMTLSLSPSMAAIRACRCRTSGSCWPATDTVA